MHWNGGVPDKCSVVPKGLPSRVFVQILGTVRGFSLLDLWERKNRSSAFPIELQGVWTVRFIALHLQAHLLQGIVTKK